MKPVRRSVEKDGQGGKVKKLTIGDWMREVKKYKGSEEWDDKGKKVKQVNVYRGYKDELFALKDTPNLLKRTRRKVKYKK